MESPVSPMEAREAKPYAGESETPFSLSLGVLTLASVALVAIAIRAFDGAIGFNAEPLIGLGLPLGSALIIWGLIRQSVTLRWGIGVPTKRQALAQVRRSMVVGGYLPHDMALWSPRPFRAKLKPRERIVEVIYTGALCKAPEDLGAYMLDAHATDAEYIDVVVPPRRPGQTVSFIVILRYDLDRDV